MKVYIVCLIVLLTSFSFATFGQDSVRIEYAKLGAKKMTELLGLSTEQSVALEKLNLDLEFSMDSINTHKMKDNIKGGEKLRVYEKRESDLKKLFTPAQYDLYVKDKESHIPTLPKRAAMDAKPGGFVSDEQY